MKKLTLILLVMVCVLIVGCQEEQLSKAGKCGAKKYEPTWESLREYKEIPKWLRDGKYGIYTHWGPYAVHAFGENTTWYSHGMYIDPESEARKHFEKKFGKLTPTFGYKDLIPKFTAHKFNADEWAELFAKSGAKFAGPVAEHHDGFAMWDTKYSDWNAAKMGPKRDVVGEFEKAVRKRNMKFVTAFHHAANWFFFPVWDKRYDTGDPKYAGLYGQQHEEGAMRNQEFLDEWYGKIIEVIDKYSPDFIWFDFALDSIPEGYVKDFLAYYYNDAEAKGKEVVVTYKGNDIVPATGVRDLELGQEAKLTYHEWITDSTVDDRGAWGYAEDLIFKPPDRVVDNLVDRVSKNGYLLLNVGPKPDGTIPEGARKLLLELGAWLDVNGEAIYGTSPWMIAGEGPTNLGEASDIGFNEADTVYTSEDIRFTVKGDDLYAIFLAWPGEEAIIKTLRLESPEEEEDEEDEDWDDEDEDEDWDEDDEDIPSIAGKTFTIEQDDAEYTWEFKDQGQVTVSGGIAGEGKDGTYEQEGEEIIIRIGTFRISGMFDGEEFEIEEREEGPRYPGFYPQEIKRITMLGDGRELDWEITREGLIIETPNRKPCKYAYAFKIERYHHPKID
ncbi:MAG TPA: alpha-L-fucosidase [Planctomycetes bacterium]|nr:alpha-L-fucosidase [Planctomycetota bacterium]HIJ69846.1 alpha-L-fucosidase [Planctomycetota bacterium]